MITQQGAVMASDKGYSVYIRLNGYTSRYPMVTELTYDEALRFLRHEEALGHDVCITTRGAESVKWSEPSSYIVFRYWWHV